jgi:hypothetical protein
MAAVAVKEAVTEATAEATAATVVAVATEAAAATKAAVTTKGAGATEGAAATAGVGDAVNAAAGTGWDCRSRALARAEDGGRSSSSSSRRRRRRGSKAWDTRRTSTQWPSRAPVQCNGIPAVVTSPSLCLSQRSLSPHRGMVTTLVQGHPDAASRFYSIIIIGGQQSRGQLCIVL